jgi:hypothetical protein
MDEMIPGTEIEKPVVELTGNSGNAFYVIGAVKKALRRAGVPASVVAAFTTEATSGDYNQLLYAAQKYVDVV